MAERKGMQGYLHGKHDPDLRAGIERNAMKEAEKLKLPNVTLCAMTSVRVRETIKAMEYSMKGIEFADALFISDKKAGVSAKGHPLPPYLPAGPYQ